MISKGSLDDSTIVDEDSSYFLCRCGAEFGNYQRYKRHQQHSHHEIGKEDSHSIKFEAQLFSFSQNFSQNDPEKEGTELANTEFNAKEEAIIHPQQCRPSQASIKQAVLKLYAKRLIQKVIQKQKKTEIYWNDFTLTPNKDCFVQPFFCGNCQIIFPNSQQFVIHCIEDCHNLDHRNSSHFIKSRDASEQRNQLAIGLSSCEQAQANKEDHQFKDEKDPMKEILEKSLDHKNIELKCGCSRIFIAPKTYYNHILLVHQSNTLSCSHIILPIIRTQRYRDFQFIYLSPNVQWINNDAKYYCSCQPDIKVTMKDLICHVIETHHGISPAYNLFQHKQKQPKQQIIQENTTIQLNQLQNRNFIHLPTLDHKNYPFFCGACKINLQNSVKYKNHFLKLHNSKIDCSSSHIIINIVKGSKYCCRYLTLQRKWMHNRAIYYCPCNLSIKMPMSELIKHVFDHHNGISPLYYEAKYTGQWRLKNKQKYHSKDPVESLFKKVEDHRKMPFICNSCSTSFKLHQYSTHIKQKHNNMIDLSCSHIILRSKYRMPYSLFISQHIKWTNDASDQYYCPCQIELKMTMNQLVHHVQQMHHGISPDYYFTNEQDVKTIEQGKDNSCPNSQKMQAYQSSININNNQNHKQAFQKDHSDDFHFFRVIYKKNLDHRNEVFRCGCCNTLCTDGQRYSRHHIRHNYEVDRCSSHIILRLMIWRLSCHNIYLSPQIKWINEDANYFCPCSKDTKITMNQLIQHVMDQHQGFSPDYNISPQSQRQAREQRQYENKNLERILMLTCKNNTIRAIIESQSIQKSIPFTCAACNFTLPPQQYTQHIIRNHNQQIHPTSSHVLIKIQDQARIFRYLFLSSTASNNLIKYYCPCNPSKKMNIESYIEHIRATHKGVSPTYNIWKEQ